MDKIYIIGDMDTVSAFRLSGLEGAVASPDVAAAKLEEIIGKRDAGIVLVTNNLAETLQARITDINLNMPNPVIIEIPGIDDAEGFHRSAMSYIAEALGVSL